MKHDRLGIIISAVFVLVITTSCFWIPQIRPDLKFEPDKLPDAQVGVPYMVEIRVSQNETPVGAFDISNGALPKGLKLIKVEGEDIAKITGTPEETSTITFTVSVWCYGTNVSGQTGSVDYVMVVK
jgi:hypothetical protein